MVQLDASNYMARIIGCCQEAEVGYYTSSGSEHDGGEDQSPSLSDLVDCFLEESCSDDYKNNNNNDAEVGEEEEEVGESSERVDSVSQGLYEELRRLVVSDKEDQYRNALLSQVYSALETLQLNLNHQMVLRGVVSHLRSLGYNAAVCKTKWDTSDSGGLVSGSHEFIDVVVTNSSSSSSCSHVIRYVIELDLASKFEIARPTESYKRLLCLLRGAAAFVGKEMEMKKIVKVMSEAAKRSLKRREMYLPPWRKNRYMQMMWFGPYKRTTNAFPAAALQGRNGGGGGMWKAEFIRAVGFNPVFDGIKGR